MGVFEYKYNGVVQGSLQCSLCTKHRHEMMWSCFDIVKIIRFVNKFGNNQIGGKIEHALVGT